MPVSEDYHVLFTLLLKIEAYHKPSETWHITKVRHGLRAVSRKHALNKGLLQAVRMPANSDRVGHLDWIVEASATILED